MLDPRRHLLELLRPLAPGDQVLPGATLAAASSELGLRLRFEVGGEALHVEIEPADPARPAAARTERLAISYRASESIDSAFAQRLCAELARRHEANERRVLGALHDASPVSKRIRHVRVDALMEAVAYGAQRFYTVSPYVGCLIGCRFCYAQSSLSASRRLLGLPDVPWGSYVDARINAPEVLERELGELPPRPIKFCPVVSDPYQAIEARERITRRCLEVIRRGPPSFTPLLLTRSELVLEDADLIASIGRAWVGVSLTTVDDEVRACFEPRAASVETRLRILGEMASRGVRTFAVVQPILPGPLDRMADELEARGVHSVSIDVLRGEEGAARDFDHPSYAHAREDGWQRGAAERLESLLADRGIPVWKGELPPGVA